MTDVLQVLEFPKAKLYLLKQLRITKIIHITALKFTLSRGHLFGSGRSMGGGGGGGGYLFYCAGISGGELRGDIFKVLEPSKQELEELKLLSHEEQLLHYRF